MVWMERDGASLPRIALMERDGASLPRNRLCCRGLASAGRGFTRRVLALWGFCFAERSPRGAAVEESCGSSLGVGGQRVRERVRVSPL